MIQRPNKNKPLLLGCIADDITGATDIGLMLARNGMPTSVFFDVPTAAHRASTPAVVIALKIRTAAAIEAVRQASGAADWLISANARQLFYKYCSTFDSTDDGNIGPVAEMLLDRVGAQQTVLLPAFPDNGRTVQSGHLLVNGVLLSESSMRNHPLTPMTESYLPRLIEAQTEPGVAATIEQATVDVGKAAIIGKLSELRAAGKRYVSIDTGRNADFLAIADATIDFSLLTGGSGIASAIPQALRNNGLLASQSSVTPLPRLPGNAAVLAGSCSQATREQIGRFEATVNPIVIDPIAISEGNTHPQKLASRAADAVATNDILVYSSADPTELQRIQNSIGAEKSAHIVEDTLAHIAKRLAHDGIKKFIVAGGETSGAIANALAISEAQISDEIDPGVPWMVASEPSSFCLAFKSGNFGRTDFFSHALSLLP